VSRVAETRKVQRFGRSTLMVSLPSEWVKSVGLKPGDMVRIEVREDGTLLVIPSSIIEKKIRGKEVTIKINHTTPEEILVRSIYAMYIAGYDRIVIESDEPYILGQQLHAIRNIVRMLIGAEIIEQTANRVMIQVFIDVERYGLENLVLRMLNSIKSMLDFLLLSIRNGRSDQLRELMELEYELDRVHALAVRHTYVLSMLGGTPFLTEYRALIKDLEDIGDALSNAAQAFLDSPDLLRKVYEILGYRLEELKEMLFYILDIMYDALSKSDVYIASKAVDLASESCKFISKLETEIMSKIEGVGSEYTKLKTFFDKLQLVCNHLQGAAELSFDIVLGKAGELIDLRQKK